MAFTLHSAWNTLQTKVLEKDSATVLTAFDFCALDANGLAVVASATDTALAYVMVDAPAGTTEVVVLSDYSQAFFTGTADQVFATTNRNTEVDLVINSGVQEVDLWASTTDVFKVLGSVDAGTVGSDLNVKFKLNKPICL